MFNHATLPSSNGIVDSVGMLADYLAFKNVSRSVGRGHWAMPPLSAEGALCDFSTASNRECFYRENVVGGRHPTRKSLQ